MSKEPLPPASQHFYRALEDRHRGSRELIKSRLCVYLPYVTAAAALHPDLSALAVLDAGCGRGEWLELLKDHHIPAVGVDTDADMLAACAGLGLTVHHADVLVYLQGCADHSLLALTGFHIAEHLPFPQLQDLFAQAWRVLVPGGLLILETPNPENLAVGTASFYIDPTHQRPLPMQLLSFLAEHQGFAPVKLLRLQEEQRLTQNLPVNLYDVLVNVSPDYAVVAQTRIARAPEISNAVRPPNELAGVAAPDSGASLFALASRYEQGLQQQLQSLQAQSSQQLLDISAVKHSVELALSQAQQLSAAHQQLAIDNQQLSAAQQQLALGNQQLSAAQQQLGTIQQQLALDNQQLSAAQQQLALQQAAVYASLSWRITAPLRWVSRHLGLRAGRRKL